MGPDIAYDLLISLSLLNNYEKSITRNYKNINLFKNIILYGDSMAKEAEELMKKCENLDDSTVMGSCQVLLKMMDEKDVEVEEGEMTYLEMAENLKPQDVSKILQIALKVRESGDIKDPDVKNAASKLIRAIEMS